MRAVEAFAVLLLIGLSISVAVNFRQYDSTRELESRLSSYDRPLALETYTITEDAITLTLWNQGTSEVHLNPLCNVNGWRASSFNQNSLTVPPSGTVVLTINGPIECNNATYNIVMPYYNGTNDRPQDIANFAFSTTIPRGTVVYEPPVASEQAIATGRDFLDAQNYTTGQVLSTGLSVLEPNDYWHGMFGIPNDAQPGFQHCWIIQFEKACCPGHFYEVFINSETGNVIGGTQCR